MGFGCFSGDKESKRHAQSQLKFLEEQNLELANALNEWQALVRQLQQEGESLKSDNAGLGATVEQHERTIEQQASDARDAEAEAAELRQSLLEARAQCFEMQQGWEGSVNECAQLDSQLAAEQHKVAELQEQIEGYKSDKDYLMEALEKREKALRMAEQVMDMVDMMQTPKGLQDVSGFNWGGEDLEIGLGGADPLAGANRASSGACGLLKGVLGSGLASLDAGPPKGTSSRGPEACTSPRARSSCRDTAAAAAAGGAGQRDSSLPPRSSQFQVNAGAHDDSGFPSVQRSQSPDMRNMGLRHSIQATKLVLAQSRSSSMSLRPSSAPEAKDVTLSSKASAGGAAEVEGAAGSKAAAQGRSSATHSPARSTRSSKSGKDSVAGSKVRHSSSSTGSSGAQDKQPPGSARNSNSSSITGGGGVGVSGGSKGMRESAAEGPLAASRSSSARSSRSTGARCEAALAGTGAHGTEAKPSTELQTPPDSGKNAAPRGSANGVLDSLVGSVVYDAMGPSPIQSSAHGDASVASSGMGAFLQDERTRASQQVGEAQGSSAARADERKLPQGSAAATAARHLHSNGGVSTSQDAAKQEQQQPEAHAAGSLAHAVAMAMQCPQDSSHKQLGESGSSTGGSVNHSCNGSTDKDAALMRYPGSASSRAGSGSSAGGGASLTAAAAALGGSAGVGQGGGHGVRKGPSVRGPTGVGVLPGSRPSPLKLGTKMDTAKAHRSSGSNGEDVVRDADQAYKVA